MEWQETASTFAASIQSVNLDGSYDVLYEERVDGKTCVEKFVARDRIEPQPHEIPIVSDYWLDEDEVLEAPPRVSPARIRKPKHSVENSKKMQSDDEDDDAFQSRGQRSKIVSKLLMVHLVIIISGLFLSIYSFGFVIFLSQLHCRRERFLTKVQKATLCSPPMQQKWLL